MPSLVTTGAAVLHAPLFVIVFLVVSAGIGWRFLHWLSVPAEAPFSERIVVALMLGAGALQFVPFALGALGQLSVSSLRIALAVFALLSLPDAGAAVRAGRSAFRDRSAVPRWLLLWMVALTPMLLVALLLALTPTLDPDGLGYHLTVPKRWLSQGSLGYLPTYPYSNTPMGVEMLFMNGLAVAGDTAAKLVHFSLGTLGAVGLYAAGKRLGGRPVGVVASTAFLCGPFGVGPLLGWAYLEGATSAAIIVSGLAWLIWLQERDRAWLRCAVLLAGLSVSFKLTAGLFPVSLITLTVLALGHEARAQHRPVLPVLASVAKLAPLVVLPVAPWLLRSAIVTGNPLFPMGAQWIPSRDFSAKIAKAFEHYNRYMVWGINLGPSWTLERRQLFFVAIAIALALCGGFVAWRQRSFMTRSTALVVLGTLLIQLAAAGLYKRYWIPVLSIFQVPMIALFAQELSASWVRGALVGVTAVLSLFQARQSLKTVENDAAGLIKTALGAEAQSFFLTQHLALFPLYQLANRDLAPNAGVVMSQYCGGFYLDRSTYCADITQESLRYTSLATCVGDLRHLGITHAIAPRFWALPGSKPTMEGGNVSMLVREGEHACISQLIRDHGHLLFAAGDQGLYALSLDSLP